MPQWFDDWAACYCRTFGIDSDAELDMVLSWEAALTANTTAGELRAATDWLLTHPTAFEPIRAKAERHLNALHRAVLEIRAVSAKQQEAEHEWGECSLCGSTGYVSVPRLESVQGGRWLPLRGSAALPPEYTTYLVACRCQLGQWKNSRRPPSPRLLTLDEYERGNPDWWSHLAGRRIEQAERAKLQPPARDGPEERKAGVRLDELIRLLMERYGIDGGD